MSYAWTKIGGDGINSSWNIDYEAVRSLTILGTKLYAGLGDSTGDAEVWECTPGSAWTKIGGDGVNSSWNTDYEYVESLIALGTKLYAGLGKGTGDAEVWEYNPDTTTWTKIGGDGVNSSWNTDYEYVCSLIALGTKLYAGLGSDAGDAEVWEYNPDTTTWTKIGDWGAYYQRITSLTVLNSKLYAGLGTSGGDADVFECTPGSAWTQIGGDGVNSSWDTDYERVESLTTLNSKLYAGLGSGTGDAEVWECTPGSAWTKIGGDGVNSSWNTDYEFVFSLTVLGTKLYAGLGSGTGDAEVWECTPGSAWTKIGGDGVNSSWNTDYEYIQSLIALNSKLYAGLSKHSGDAEVWELSTGESSTDVANGNLNICNHTTDGANGWLEIGQFVGDAVNGNLFIWEPQTDSVNGWINIWGSPTDKVNGRLIIHEPQTDSANGNLVITGFGTDSANGNLFIWQPQIDSANGNLFIWQPQTDSVNGNLNIRNHATDVANGNLLIWEPPTDAANGNLNIRNHDTDSVNGNLLIWEPPTDKINGWLNIFTSAIGDWTKIGGDGVNSSWDTDYESVHSLIVLGTKLYAGLGYSTGNAEVWEYDPGTTTWAKIGGDGVNSSWDTDYERVHSLTVLGTKLYAGLGSGTGDAEVWEYDPGTTTWAKIGGDGVNSSWDIDYELVHSLIVLGTKLYAGLGSGIGDAEVWEYDPGTTTWAKIGGDGVNSSWDTDYERVYSLTVLGTKLYAGLGSGTGDAEVWEYDPGTTTWAKIGGDGVNSSWDTDYERVYSLTVLGTKLYAGLGSGTGDAEVWELILSTTDRVNGNLNIRNHATDSVNGNLNIRNHTTDSVNGNLNIRNHATDVANGNLLIWEPPTDAANGNLLIWEPPTDAANGNLLIWEPPTDKINGWLNIFTSAIGDWTKIGGDGVNSSWDTDYESVHSLIVLGIKLYAGLGWDTGDAEVWEYDPGTTTWAKIGGDGVNSSWDTDYESVHSLIVLGTKLYAGLGNDTGDAEVWEYDPGTTTWAKIGGDGVNSSWDTDYEDIYPLTVLGTKLYAGLGYSTGNAEVWEYDPGTTTWAKIGGDGVNSSWDTDYESVLSLTVLGTKLYAGLGNDTGDAEVWEYDPGTTTWSKIGGDEINSSWGLGYGEVFSLTVLKNKLYAGLGWGTGDAEIWELTLSTTDNVNGNLWVYNHKIDTANGNLFIWESQTDAANGNLNIYNHDTAAANGNLNIRNHATDQANGWLKIEQFIIDTANGNLFIWESQTDAANGNLNIYNHDTAAANGNLFIWQPQTDDANGNLFIWEPQIDSINGNLTIWGPPIDKVNGNLIISGFGHDAVNGNLTILAPPTDSANGWLRIETPIAVTNPSANVQFWNAAKTAEVLNLDQIIELATATTIVELWFYNDKPGTQSPGFNIESIYIGNRCANRQYTGQTPAAGQEQIDEKWMELRSTEAAGCTPDNQSAWTPVGGDTITGALLPIGDIPHGAGRKIELRFNVPGGADSDLSVSQIYVCFAEIII